MLALTGVVTPSHGQNQPWIPPRSTEMDQLARSIEEALTTDDPLELKPVLTQLADRIFDGDPGGSISVGDGFHIGPGEYLKMTLEVLPQAVAEEIRNELRLSLRSKFLTVPSVGIDSRVDRNRTRQILDLSADLLGDEWVQPLIQAALERGDFGQWELLRDQFDHPQDSNPLNLNSLDSNFRQGQPAFSPSGIPVSVVVQTNAETESSKVPWKKTSKSVGVLHHGTTLWVQNAGQLSAHETATGTLLWQRNIHPADVPDNVKNLIRQQQPALSVQCLASSTETHLQGFDAVTGELLWTLSRDQILGASADPTFWTQLSDPVAVPGGFVIAAQRYSGNRVEAYMSRITRSGKISWVRPIGESTGATWLALQSWTAAPEYRNGRIFWNSGRGTVLSLREQDGAVLWAREVQQKGPVGLRDQLENINTDRSDLLICRRQLFHQVPGSARISRFTTESGRVLPSLPIPEGAIWTASTSGDRAIVISSDGEIQSWKTSPGETDRPQLEWSRYWPCESTITPIKVSIRPSGNIAIATSKVLSTIDPQGRWIAHMAWMEEPQSAQFHSSGICIHSASAIEWWPADLAGDFVDWENFIQPPLSLLMKHRIDSLEKALQFTDLSPRDAMGIRLKNQVRWTLDRNDLSIPFELRNRAEVALISSENSSRQRIQIGWSRALQARRSGANETADTICQLMLMESTQQLRSIRVAVPRGPLILAETAFTGVLLELDQRPGGQERIRIRELRATKDLERLGNADPSAWNSLATRHPGTPTGRIARLKAAESYYRAKDLETCLQQLNFLILREPLSDESLVARLRKVEVLREQGQRRKAIAEIKSLKEQHGDRVLSRTIDGKTISLTLSQRLDDLRLQIESLEKEIDPVPGLPLELAWTGRLELDQLRSTTVHPLHDFQNLAGDSRYLILTPTGARLMDSKSGRSLWKFDLEQNSPVTRGGIFLDRSRQACRLLTMNSSGIWLWNKKSIFKLETQTGQILWRRGIPDSPVSEEEQEFWIHAVSDGDAVIGISDSRRIYHLDPNNGESLWTYADRGILIDTPKIREGQLLLGYSIPDKVEVREIHSGEVTHSWDLEGEVSGLSNSPSFTPSGYLYSTEGGIMTHRSSDGSTLWETQLPSEISEVQLTDDEQQIIVRQYWSDEHPTLLGIQTQDGKLLWQKKLPQSLRRVVSVSAIDEEILVLCDGFTERSLICLKTPNSVPITAIPEAEQLWKRDLVPSYDAVDLRIQGSWLLVVDRLRGDLSILDRFTGTPLDQKNGLEAVTRYTRPLGRMHAATVLGDRLIIVCARGSAAFHSQQPFSSEKSTWQQLGSFLDMPPPTDPDFQRRNSISHEVEIRENLLKDTLTPLLEKSYASWELESLERLNALSRLDEIQVPFMPVAPVIDGSLSEPWNTSAGISLEQPRFVRSLQGIGEIKIPWQDRSDLSGKLFLGWTEKGLHIAVEVSDDQVTVHNRDALNWTGDCLLMVLDTLGDGGQTPRSDDQVLTLAFVPPRQQEDPEEEEDIPGESAEELPFPEDEPEEPEGQHVVAHRGDQEGVTYEMMIPWSSILAQRDEQMTEPWPGMKMRLGIAVTDDDTGTGATKYLGLTPGMVLHKVMERLWEGCCPDLLLPIRLIR